MISGLFVSCSKSSSSKTVAKESPTVDEVLNVVAKIRTQADQVDIESIDSLSNEDLVLKYQDGTSKTFTTKVDVEGDEADYTLDYMCGTSATKGSGDPSSFAAFTLTGTNEEKSLEAYVFEGTCANSETVSCAVIIEKDSSGNQLNTYGMELDQDGGCDPIAEKMDLMLEELDTGSQSGRVRLFEP